MTTGTEILTRILNKVGSEREKLILEAILVNKETPAFLEKFIPVYAHGKDNQGDDTIIEYLVKSDYLSVGTDLDFLRIPMYPTTAQKIADAWDCLLPTKRMVDQIYEAGVFKLLPATYQPKVGEPGRGDSRAYEKTNKAIQGQLINKIYLGFLVVGQKKDIVLCNGLLKYPKNVAIYGWHIKKGAEVIQGLNAKDHSNSYVDYSHGIRLISKTCKVNGVEMSLEDVLKSEKWGRVLMGDEPLKFLRYP